MRTFQTTYDTEGTSYMIGNDDINNIDKLSKIAQRMRDGNKCVWVNSRNKKEKFYRKAETKREKRGLLKAASKIENVIKNNISDLHRKTAKFLCEKYDTVIIPNFRVKQMTQKKDSNNVWKRNIGSETTRKMLNLGHYKFRQLLIAKGEATGTKIIIGTEEWTSKTCGNCTWINHWLSNEKELKCENCDSRTNRDINAARNIMMLNWDRANLSLKPQPKIYIK